MRDSEYGISEVNVNQIGGRVATGPSHFRPRPEIAAQSTVAADVQYLDPVTAPTQRLSNSPDDDPPSGESIRRVHPSYEEHAKRRPVAHPRCLEIKHPERISLASKSRRSRGPDSGDRMSERHGAPPLAHSPSGAHAG